MEEISKDSRFAHTVRDPRFKPNLKQKKVKLDSRFKSILKDEDFKVNFMDKRGRPIVKSSRENLGRLYDYESGEDDDSDDVEESKDEDKDQALSSTGEDEEDSKEEDEVEDDEYSGKARVEKEQDDSSDEDDDEEVPEITEDGPDYARGGGTVVSSDEGDDDDCDQNGELLEEEQGLLPHDWNEPDRDAPQAEEITSRLALCNMDWDRIKAKDLYVLFNSFTPQGGAVQSVTIYPSEIGKQKMAEEEKLGPQEFRQGSRKGEEKEGGSGKLNRALLRQYQLSRLAYFYAVIICDSKDTASKIYEECDSMEYEKSSCRIDLRFIPEDMTFDDTPKDACAGVPDLSNFKPSAFTTTAFCQAKVQVTWDETNIERLSKTMKKKFTEEDLETDQFDGIIASADEENNDEESEEEKKERKNKKKKGKKSRVKNYRKLLGLDENGDTSKKKKKSKSVPSVGGEDEEDEEEQEEQDAKEEDFTPELNKKKKTKKLKNNEKNKSDDDDDESEEDGEMEFTWQSGPSLQKLQKQGKEKLTPWEQFQQKKKEKKKLKKKDRKLERLRQLGVEDTSELGFDDDFFKDEPDVGKKKDKKKGRKGRKLDKEEIQMDEKEKAALELLVKDGDDDRSHFSLLKLMEEEAGKKKKRRGKKRQQGDMAIAEDDNFEVDLSQSRFAGLLTDPEMRIDPNAPEFKKTKAMLNLMDKVVKKRKRIGD